MALRLIVFSRRKKTKRPMFRKRKKVDRKPVGLPTLGFFIPTFWTLNGWITEGWKWWRGEWTRICSRYLSKVCTVYFTPHAPVASAVFANTAMMVCKLTSLTRLIQRILCKNATYVVVVRFGGKGRGKIFHRVIGLVGIISGLGITSVLMGVT